VASPEFAAVEGNSAPAVEPFGLLDALPNAVIDTARVWAARGGGADRLDADRCERAAGLQFPGALI
jgi:hypothetical protein